LGSGEREGSLPVGRQADQAGKGSGRATDLRILAETPAQRIPAPAQAPDPGFAGTGSAGGCLALAGFALWFVLFSSCFFVTPCHAQWGVYASSRDAYALYRGDRTGLFFPQKDPEEQELSLGPLVFRPGLAVSETYTSNLTFSSMDAQEDFVTRLFPALGLKLPYKRATFEAEYLGDLAWYSRQARFNADDHYLTARVQANLFRDSWLFINSVTGLLYTPVEDVRTYIPELNQRRRFNYYNNYIAFHPASYRKFGVSVRYGNYMTRFQKAADTEGDYTIHMPGVLLGYFIQRKTRLLLGYGFTGYTSKQAFPSSDYQEHSLIFGVEWSLAERLRMTAEGTYNWDRFTDISESLQVWGARVNARYTPLKRLAFEANYRRSARPTLSFTGERFDPLTDTFSIYYIEDVADLSCEYHFRRNLLVWANVMYKRFDYPQAGGTGESRLDNIYGGTLQVIYTFRPWLRLSLSGGYSRDDSNSPFESYENISGQFFVQGCL